MFKILTLALIMIVQVFSAGDCGKDGGNKKCAARECCSEYSFCGTTKDHCNAKQ